MSIFNDFQVSESKEDPDEIVSSKSEQPAPAEPDTQIVLDQDGADPAGEGENEDGKIFVVFNLDIILSCPLMPRIF